MLSRAFLYLGLKYANACIMSKQLQINNTPSYYTAIYLFYVPKLMLKTLKSCLFRATDKSRNYFKAQRRSIYFPKNNKLGVSTGLSLLLLLISVSMLSSVDHAEAGSLHALLNGKAVHLESAPASQTYNEDNWGGGLQYDFDPWHENWIPFVSASGFLDSNSNASYYAGGGIVRRFTVSEKLDNLHVDAGVVSFLMTRKGFRNNKPFLGLLPVLSIGTEYVSVNMTYIPKVEPKMVALFFFQLKIKMQDF